MSRAKYSSAFRLLPALLLSGSPLAYAADNAAPSKWNPWLDTEAKLGNHRTLGIVDGFAPVWQNQDSLIFFNPRVRLDDQESQEYNLGAGYRTLRRDWVLGAYGFADRNVSPSGNAFYQMTLGAEALGTNLKFRFNDYQPVGDRQQIGTPNVIIKDSTLMISGGVETSMQGNDVEFGYRVPLYDANNKSQLWVYGGGYHFDGSDTEMIAGLRARAEYEVGSLKLADHDVRLRLSGEIEHDTVRNTNYFAGIRIGIPFGGPSSSAPALSPLERHMIDPVERDVDIVVGKSLEHAINPLSGNAVKKVDTVSYTTADAWQRSINNAGADSVTVLDGSHGNFVYFVDIDDPAFINLNNGQALISPGGSLLLRGAKSGAMAAYIPGGTAATITNLQDFIQLGRNNAISGLTITSPVNTFAGTDPGNFSFTHNTVSGSTSVSERPLELSASTPFTATIDHNTFTNNETGAVLLDLHAGVTSANITYTNNVATNNDSGAAGILGSAFTILTTGVIGPTSVTMSGNTVTGNDRAVFYSNNGGSFSSFTGTFTDNNFSNNGAGITYATDATNVSLTVTGNNLSDNGDSGLGVVATDISNLDLVVDHNQINNNTNGANGIALSGISNQLNMQITNNSLNNNQGSAILHYNSGPVPDINAVVSHNTIRNNQNLGANSTGGVDIEGFNSLNLTMDSNDFNLNIGGGTFLGTTVVPPGAMNVTFTNNTRSGVDSFTMQFDGANKACATINGNTGGATTYNLFNTGTGTFTLVTSDALTPNVIGVVGSAASCP